MAIGAFVEQIDAALQALAELRARAEEAAVEALEPVASVDELGEDKRFMLTLLGVDNPQWLRHTFEDGTEFKVQVRSPYIPDWDAIARLGQSDASGEKWRPYNKGKAAWNALETAAARAENKEFYDARGFCINKVGLEGLYKSRIAAYEGGFRFPFNTWPSAYLDVLKEARPELFG